MEFAVWFDQVMRGDGVEATAEDVGSEATEWTVRRGKLYMVARSPRGMAPSVVSIGYVGHGDIRNRGLLSQFDGLAADILKAALMQRRADEKLEALTVAERIMGAAKAAGIDATAPDLLAEGDGRRDIIREGL